MTAKNTVEVIIKNNNIRKKYPQGTTLKKIAQDINLKLAYPVIGALVNNKIKELEYTVFCPKTIRFFDITHPDGIRMYVRSLNFILIKAAKNLYPKAQLKIEHSISNGYYCEFANIEKPLTDTEIAQLRKEMKQIIDADIQFDHKKILTTEAIEIFEQNGYADKALLLKTRKSMYSTIYKLDNLCNYFYGALVPSTGYIKIFDLVKYHNGMLLKAPTLDNPEQTADIVVQNKMFEIFREYKERNHILGLHNTGKLNEATQNNTITDVIKVSEALQEKKLARIADMIRDTNHLPHIILISGPSSSGKTTFAKRLGIHLRIVGITPHIISLDDYFVNREETPLDENGEYDFENIEALDIPLFNLHLSQLIKGEKVELPHFSFETGHRVYRGDYLQITPNSVLIMEGIHALNPYLTKDIANEEKFKIYVSALTALCMDDHNRIPTTDNRLIRRMVRDNRYRGYSAKDTIKRWPSVRRGEDKYIFPYQEEADVMYNSALIFELGVLKQYAVPLLMNVSQQSNEYAEAIRLLKFFEYLETIPENEIPPTSILREFLFGSSFKYH